MNAQVTAAAPGDQALLEALFQLYAYDLSAELDLDVGGDGRFRGPALDGYWTDPRRHAFVLRIEGAPAGFAWIDGRSRLTGDEAVWDVAEFFVLRRYRRRGVGTRVASWLFDRFRGTWEVRQRAENDAAIAFWRRAIGQYTRGRFEDVLWDDERWRGPVQRFESKGPSAGNRS